MPVKDPALLDVDAAPFINDGRKRWRTCPVALLKTIIGWGEPISRTAPLLVLTFGLRAMALARTGEPRSMILPAGVSVWLSDATTDPSFCGPTVRLGLAACEVCA